MNSQPNDTEELKPQNTTNYEVGADLHFFGSRLKVEYTYSLQNVEDQIFYVPVDGATGYQEMLTNAGKMRTHAHELSINAAILQTVCVFHFQTAAKEM